MNTEDDLRMELDTNNSVPEPKAPEKNQAIGQLSMRMEYFEI